MAESAPHRISLAAATSIVVASMVGVGIFTSLGFQIGAMPSGFPVMLLWVVGGVTALCGALCYAELVAMMPRSGGEYHLLGRAFHPLIGFLAGWVSVTAGFSATVAFMAMSFGAYVHGVWPGVSEAHAAVGVLAVLTLLRLCGARWMERFHVGLTALKVVLILVLIVGALAMGHPDWSVLRPKAGDGGLIWSEAFATSLFWVMFSFSGWNGAAYVAGEMHHPQRNVPLALGLGTLIVMALYVGFNAVFLAVGDWSRMAGTKEVALVVAQGVFGGAGGAFMGGLIAFGLLSTVNAMLWSGSATLRVVGQDARALCWLDAPDRRGEPVGAVLFMSAFALVLLGTGSFNALLNYIQALLELSAAITVAAVVWLRIRHPAHLRPFRMPLYPLPPLIFLGVSGWMLYSLVKMRPAESLWGAATLILGFLLYLPGVEVRRDEEAPA